MLSELRIENLAVVESVTLRFGDGLNILTGSTGTGKSLILSAVNLLLGERSDTRSIRSGKDTAVVEGEFRGEPPPAARIHVGPGETLVLRREVHRTGRSQASINGRPCTLKALQEVARALIEPHGQNEQYKLKSAENHLAYLDTWAKHGGLIEDYRDAHAAYREAERRLDAFDRRLAEAKEKRELLEHRVEEIDRARVERGEKERLEADIRIHENAEAIHAALNEATRLIYETDESGVNLIAQSRRGLSRLAGVDRRIAAFAGALESAEITLKDVANEMSSYLNNLEFDPDALEVMRERVVFLTSLERRYRKGLDEVLADYESWKAQLDSIAVGDDERKALVREKERRSNHVRSAATALSRSRREAARTLDTRMSEEMAALMIRGATFRTNLSTEPDEGGLVMDGRPARLGADGIDRVEFYVRTNPGEVEGPVCEIASSGELSRIALGLKNQVSIGREGSLLVFDEVDSGVGADLGAVIGGRLRSLGQRYQIICITHLPQIAVMGREHFVVHKKSAKGRTFARVERVEGGERVKEIARMLGGKEGSEKRLALAAEMLQVRVGEIPTDGLRP